jgi:hypothetical protein
MDNVHKVRGLNDPLGMESFCKTYLSQIARNSVFLLISCELQS